MKSLLLLLFTCALFASAYAQNNQLTKDEAGKLLAGTWIVQDKVFLPPPSADGVKEFMRDTLVFATNNTFKNGPLDARLKSWDFYSSDKKESILFILDVDDFDGVEYSVETLTKETLTVTVYKGDFTPQLLTYKKADNK